jgi:hypothetical protein
MWKSSWSELKNMFRRFSIYNQINLMKNSEKKESFSKLMKSKLPDFNILIDVSRKEWIGMYGSTS